MGNLGLRRHYPTEITYWVSEDAHEEELVIEASVNVAAGPNTGNPLDWRVGTTVVFSATSKTVVVAKGSISFVGFFDAPDQVPEDKRADFMTTQGSSILYSATRELVANLTARTAGKLITLPPVIFANMARGPMTEKKEVRSASV